MPTPSWDELFLESTLEPDIGHLLKQAGLEEALEARSIFQAVSFVTTLKKITRTKSPGCLHDCSPSGFTASGSVFLDVCRHPALFKFLEKIPEHKLHPYLEVLLELRPAIEQLKIQCPPADEEKKPTPEEQVAFTKTVDILFREYQTRCHAPAMKTRIRNWDAQPSRNCRALALYVRSLIKYYKRILVVRVDLGYGKNAPHRHDIRTAKSDMEHLLRNRRCKPQIFAHEVGYAWRLEHTEKRGFYYHCLFFFDYEKLQQGSTYADQIGEYWQKEITSTHGAVWNCNRRINQRVTNGLGMVSHTDSEKCEALLVNAAFYLTQKDEYLTLKKPEGCEKIKLFGKGERPKLYPKTGTGRSRKDSSEV